MHLFTIVDAFYMSLYRVLNMRMGLEIIMERGMGMGPCLLWKTNWGKGD
jgi:hypothetical protein